MNALKIRRLRRLSLVCIVAAAPALGLVTAGPTSAAVPTPVHLGDPASWGPALEVLCSDPGLAADAGYVTRVLSKDGGPFTGTAQADAIFARGGNDVIRGGGGDDLICLSFGNDEAHGGAGNDAIFGGPHADDISGDDGRDFLDGGTELDVCNGGAGQDAQNACTVAISVP